MLSNSYFVREHVMRSHVYRVCSRFAATWLMLLFRVVALGGPLRIKPVRGGNS